jgi:hypothetical protein
MIRREDILKKIATSSILGDLGLFVGGGFSKSVINQKETLALSWGDLIYKSLFDLKLDSNQIQKEGLSYPELASQIGHVLSSKENISFDEAVERLKIKMAEITNWYPKGRARAEYGRYLRTIMPQWIITTNYDLILECLLPGLCITFGPEEQLFVPKKFIPIYHIHGIRTNPQSLVITQEDYIRLFRPNEYRQSKLSLTLKESTTLFIGYGLGDINVLSAVDWANNVFKGENHNKPPDIIQILVIEGSPRKEVYQNHNGTLIFEVNNLSFFFKELCKYVDECKKSEKLKSEELGHLKKYFNPSGKMINDLLKNSTARLDLFKSMARLDSFQISGSLMPISLALEKAWENPLYSEVIPFMTDLLIFSEVSKFPPVLTEMVISNLNRLRLTAAKNESLNNQWKINKKKIRPSSIQEMQVLTKTSKYPEVTNFLN